MKLRIVILLLVIGFSGLNNSIGQAKIYKGNSLSFDSLLIKKGNRSKGVLFPTVRVSNSKMVFENSILKNKVTYINFWFKACPPCIAEMPSLTLFYKKIKKLKDVQFISLTFEDKKTISEMIKKYKITYPVFSISKNDCYRLNQDNGFPTSIVVDKKGVIQFLLSGYNTDPKKAYAVLFKTVFPEIVKQINK